MEKESLSRHRRKLHIFKRRKVFVGGPYTQIQADLIFYLNYGRQNQGYKYILCVVDCFRLIYFRFVKLGKKFFSRKNWVRPQRTATADETAKNLDSIISSMPYKPTQFSSGFLKELKFSEKKFLFR